MFFFNSLKSKLQQKCRQERTALCLPYLLNLKAHYINILFLGHPEHMMADSVEHILALTPIISSALKAADSFSSAVKSSLVIVQGLGNLGDQLQALESMSENHPVILSQPDLLTRLRYSIEKSLEEEAGKMTNFL